MTKSSYLQRLKQRQQLAHLKEQIVFGLTLGWLMTLVGGFHYFFVISTNDNLWRSMLYAGIILIALSIVLPSIIYLIQKPLKDVTQKIGEFIFSLILILNYFLLILPMGVLLRRFKNNNSFYTWKSKRLFKVGGWMNYQTQESIETIQNNAKGRSLALQLAWIISYFIRNGHYLLIPVLVILLVLGLIMFFVKASALAPFIYTLF